MIERDAQRQATGGTSAIHDLGYRRYAGERLGVSGAGQALFAQSLRAMFGFGRPMKAKAIPMLVMVVSVLPSLGTLTASAASNGAIPVQYGTLISAQLLLFVLFTAAQVPEVLSRDQQHRLLPLLFTRDVTRSMYAVARFSAIYVAMLIVTLAPLLFLYLGELGIAADPATTFGVMGGKIGPVLVHALLSALVYAGIGSALASWTPRRAYATASIFGTFLLLAAVSTGLDDLAGIGMRSAELLDPIRVMRTLAMLLFGETNRAMELNPPSALGVYVGVLLAIGGLGMAIFAVRVRRIRA